MQFLFPVYKSYLLHLVLSQEFHPPGILQAVISTFGFSAILGRSEQPSLLG